MTNHTVTGASATLQSEINNFASASPTLGQAFVNILNADAVEVTNLNTAVAFPTANLVDFSLGAPARTGGQYQYNSTTDTGVIALSAADLQAAAAGGPLSEAALSFVFELGHETAHADDAPGFQPTLQAALNQSISPPATNGEIDGDAIINQINNLTSTEESTANILGYNGLVQYVAQKDLGLTDLDPNHAPRRPPDDTVVAASGGSTPKFSTTKSAPSKLITNSERRTVWHLDVPCCLALSAMFSSYQTNVYACDVRVALVASF